MLITYKINNEEGKELKLDFGYATLETEDGRVYPLESIGSLSDQEEEILEFSGVPSDIKIAVLRVHYINAKFNPRLEFQLY